MKPESTDRASTDAGRELVAPAAAGEPGRPVISHGPAESGSSAGEYIAAWERWAFPDSEPESEV